METASTAPRWTSLPNWRKAFAPVRRRVPRRKHWNCCRCRRRCGHHFDSRNIFHGLLSIGKTEQRQQLTVADDSPLKNITDLTAVNTINDTTASLIEQEPPKVASLLRWRR